MQIKNHYLPPLVEVVDVIVEQGFAGSIEDPNEVNEGDDFWG